MMKSRFLLLCLLCATLLANAQDTIPLGKALQLGIVDVTIEGHSGYGSKFKSLQNGSAHYGECIALSAKLNSDSALVLHIPIGSLLVPGDSAYQNMIITKDALVELSEDRGVLRDIRLFAMCGEIEDMSPHRGIFYDYHGEVDSLTLSVVRRISADRQQNRFGQALLWTVTDPDKVERIAKLQRDSLIGPYVRDVLKGLDLSIDTVQGKLTQVARISETPEQPQPMVKTVRPPKPWVKDVLWLIGGVVLGLLTARVFRGRKKRGYDE